MFWCCQSIDVFMLALQYFFAILKYYGLKKPCNMYFLVLSNSAACSSAVRKPAISLADSTDLRVLLNIMYLMVETIQQDDPADKPEWKIIRETFRAELGKFCSKCWMNQRSQQQKLAYLSISTPPHHLRVTSFQQWAHFSHALRYGYQVLQRTCPSFPNEEGVTAVVEEHSGETLCSCPLQLCKISQEICESLKTKILSPVPVHPWRLWAAPKHKGSQAWGAGTPPSARGQHSSHSQHEGCFSSSICIRPHRTAAKTCTAWAQGRVLWGCQKLNMSWVKAIYK